MSNYPISLKLKRLGKRKIKTYDIVSDIEIKTVRDLLTACVTHEVNKYNDKREESMLLSYLSPREIQEQAERGKVGFGDVLNVEKQNIEAALDNVILSFKDGLFVLFVDEKELFNLEENIEITDNHEITIIRLTFLSGRLY